MSVLTRTELEKLSVMYEGDKNRDASSKIRGFLFQDYVAIMSLPKQLLVSLRKPEIMLSCIVARLFKKRKKNSLNKETDSFDWL